MDELNNNRGKIKAFTDLKVWQEGVQIIEN